jgi:outer membrane protein OmpA-like peptidoglycan-associated protein
MKSLSKTGLALTAAILLVSGAVRADEPSTRAGWYAGLDGVGSWEIDSKSKNETDGTKDKILYGPGWGVSGNGGYAFGNGLRAEGELTYSRDGVDKVDGIGSNGSDASGHLRNVYAMANGYYDFDTGTRFTPYLGAGAGYSWVDAFHIATVDNRELNSQRGEFAYQGIAGLATSLDSHWVLTTDYRYFRTIDPKFETSAGDRNRTENASHNILVGLRYAFGSPSAPLPKAMPVAEAPAPMPAPAPQAEVPAVPQSFMVFFDFDRATLTPEAKRILAAAAQEFKQGKYVRLVVTGHTDTVGTAKYNEKLSIKRAEAVRAELKAQGVPANVVEAKGAGKSGLLVPTANGVREAQNRRAEIVLQQ